MAAVPRLYGLQYMEFKTDEAAVAASVRTMLETGRLIQVGIGSSVGVANAPLFDYLMAIPLALSRNPQAAVALIGVANVAAVVVTYFLGRRLWGLFAGTVAGLLFAVAPWGVAFSRKLWEQDLEPCFAAIALYALVRAREGSVWWAAGAVACWLWMVQVHPSAVLLAPIFLFAGPAFWRAAWRPSLLAGVVVGLAPLAPFAAYEVAHGWPDVHALLAAAGRPATVDGMAALAALSVLTGWDTQAIEAIPFDHFPAPRLFEALGALATAALLAALLVAAAVALASWRRSPAHCKVRHGPTLLILLAWILLPVLLATRHGVPVYPHYELTALPAAFLLMGFAAAFLGARIRVVYPPAEDTRPTRGAIEPFPIADRVSLVPNGWRSTDPRPSGDAPVGMGIPRPARASGRPRQAVIGDLALAITAVILIGWAALLVAYLRALPPEPFVWDYGVPYVTSAQIAAAGQTAADGGPLWLHVDPVIQPPLRYLLRDVRDQRALPLGALVLPAPGQSAGYLIDDVHDTEVVAALQSGGAEQVDQVMYMDSLHHAMAYHWGSSASSARLAAALQPLSARLVNGVRFLGYAVSRPDAQTLRVEIVWLVTRAGAGVTDADLALYVHVLDANGKTVSQRDDMPFPSARWQAGETVVAWLDAPLNGVAPGRYALRAGMYRRPSVQRVDAVGAASRATDGEFSLGTFIFGQ